SFFFSSRRRHTRFSRDWSSDVCSSDLYLKTTKTIKMEALKLNKETAIKLYPTAATEFRKMLEETFGEKALKPKVTDRVKTFEDRSEERRVGKECSSRWTRAEERKTRTE